MLAWWWKQKITHTNDTRANIGHVRRRPLFQQPLPKSVPAYPTVEASCSRRTAPCGREPVSSSSSFVCLRFLVDVDAARQPLDTRASPQLNNRCLSDSQPYPTPARSAPLVYVREYVNIGLVLGTHRRYTVRRAWSRYHRLRGSNGILIRYHPDRAFVQSWLSSGSRIGGLLLIAAL